MLSWPNSLLISSIGIPLCRAVVAVVCLRTWGVMVLFVLHEDLCPIVRTIFSIPSFFKFLYGLLDDTNKNSESSLRLSRYRIRATSAFALRKLVRCFLPLPYKCTDFSCQSISDLFKIASSDTRQPVLYSISMIAVSLGVSHAERRYSSSTWDRATLGFTSYLMAGIFFAGSLEI